MINYNFNTLPLCFTPQFWFFSHSLRSAFCPSRSPPLPVGRSFQISYWVQPSLWRVIPDAGSSFKAGSPRHWLPLVALTGHCIALKGGLTLEAAAAKSLQSSPTLCDLMDSSPPGSRVPGILQARTLEWVAISFSNAWKENWKWSRSVVSDS